MPGNRRALISQVMAELEAGAVAEEPAAVVEAEPEEPAGNPAAPKIVRAPAGGNIRATALTRGRLTPAERIALARAEEAKPQPVSIVARRR